MTELQIRTVEIARRHLGKQEPGPLPNRGPMVDEWLSFVGIHPAATEAGKAWCAAFASWCVNKASTELSLPIKFRRSAGALRLLEVNHELRTNDPNAGTLVIFDHGGGKGHVGIVTGVTRVGGAPASITVIAGNTSADGTSRDADSVAERNFFFPQAHKIEGYVLIA